ncbi:hypothetical protein GUITHDRAFT_113812 [Guillardia theta CCMP2712]|uniref:Uncharacterized protein n=1 Tax=Guillardia theta (strain CCMP2712) TaxID=905079 RepID=L1IV05_GUITC|nr:hypothetical protein GUITHDRAFT_113812 [Guillardia theta CCMP2712]EKX40073.1 hypothetical protein GUITHDRAFT_113812 [Guillardia theta CCMP2712]|eukprot:XP_005827053.1 hypothetical protein GUITHDRAFT_113812 [Guillardia theta CCMP2712]
MSQGSWQFILKGLPRLIDLEIDGNECSLVSGYRHVVIDQLQQIMRLDGTSILSADRENARNILKFNERQPTEVNSNRSSRNEQHDDNDNGDDKVSFWTHSEIDVPPPSSRPSSARRPATSHQNSAQYRLSNTNISTDAKQLSKVLAAKSSEYLQGPQKKMMAGLNEDENAQSDSQMFKVTENANFLNSNPILLEYLAEAAAGEEEEESVPEDVNHKEGGEAQTMLEKNFVSDGIMFVDSSAPNANGHAHHNGFDDNSASHSMRHDRPSSRRRVGFANELRKVTSAMSAVEAFSIEEIVEMMNTAKHADSQSLGEMLSEFAMGTAGQSPPQTNQRPTNKSDEMIIRRLLKTIEKLQSLQSKLALLESGSMPQEGNVNIDSLKKEIATLKIENTNMYHLQEENVSLRKQLKEIHERWNDNKLREQNSRLKTQVKHYKV